MAERVRVVRHDGRLLAAKEPGPAGADALRAEAALLDRARVPGVVELVGMRAGDAPLLLTAWVGPRSLAELPRPLDPDHAAALCLAVVGTLQRLHRCGIVHGAIEPSHVLLDDHGRPVLCGLGHAGSIGAPVRRPATGHPASPGLESGERLAPADDVAGVGRLLADLLGPVPPRGLRPAERRRAASWRALRAVADQARAEPTDARPSLASLIRSMRRAAPEATLPAGPDVAHPERTATGTDTGASRPSAARPEPTPRPSAAPPARRRAAAPLVAVTGVLVVGATTYLGLSALWSTGPEQRARAAAARPEQAAPATSRATGTATTSTRPEPSPAAPATRPPTTTTTTRPAAGTATGTSRPGPDGSTVVVHEGRSYAIGAPGDLVAVGPWRCDGVDLPAVLRTGDGTVSVFDAWAPPGGQATARTVATLPGASGLTVVPDGSGCAVLTVSGPNGQLATLTRDDLT